MNQEIRFCTTADGVRIAYATAGQGPPLVKAANWLTHLEFDWESPVWRHLFRALAENHTLIRYDERGTGLSDRNVGDISLNGWTLDMEAVVDALDLKEFALLGISQGGPTAIQYAVCHQDRVSKLVLYGSFAHVTGREELRLPLKAGVLAGWGRDNPAFRQTFTGLFIPEAETKHMRWFNELQRVSASAEIAGAILEEIFRIDVRDILPRLETPTIVLHRREDNAVTFEDGRAIAGLIPNARFVALEGENHYILEEEPEFETFLDIVEQFLGQTAVHRKPAATPLTILFTDVVENTALLRRIGDEAWRAVMREHEEIVRAALKQYGGTEISTSGDGFFASFGSSVRALQCAVEIQRALARRSETAEHAVEVRIGLNAGEPIEEGKEVLGTAVTMAARIMSQAGAGEVLVSDVVRQLVAGKGFLFADRGEFVAKGFEDPVRVYEVRWRDG